MRVRNFPPHVTEQLKSYVYMYINPETNKIFYVGKGKGNRAFQHLKKPEKPEIIHLLSKGIEPKIEIIIHGLDDETALRVEASIIDLIGKEHLTNEVRGWKSSTYGRLSIPELLGVYDNKQVKIIEPVLLIRIQQSYYHDISPEELYEYTRGVWKLGKDKSKAKYAFSVYNGLVKEVYKIGTWHVGGTTPYKYRNVYAPDRREFKGEIAEPEIRDKYLNHSIHHYLGKNTQSPVLYVNIKKK